MFPGVADPLDALSLAGYGGAVTMKAGHIARIRQAVERMAGQVAHTSAPTVDPADLFFHLRFECNHKDSVMTAWALGPEDKATIMTLFLVEAEANRAALAARIASATQVAQKATSETRAGDREGTDKARQMARQLAQELRRGEEARQLEEVEKPIAKQPPAARSEDRSGWIYLGHHDRSSARWVTTYLTLPGQDTLPAPGTPLAPGTQLVAAGRLNVRPAMPDASGKFAPVQAVLRPGAAVTLAAAPRSWQETGFIWAEVNY
jgi:hypothetical protein